MQRPDPVVPHLPLLPMPTRRIRSASAAAVCGALLASVPGSVAAQSLPAAMTARIDSLFATYTAPGSPGCAVGVMRDGTLLFAKGYGASDLQHGVPITPASVFHVASISKQFAAFSILLLERDGKLSLDDDIRRYLPEVPDFGQRITIRHLIHHTSGLRDQWSLLSLGGWRADDPKSEADILWLVGRQRALNFTPGAEHLYSNTGYTLLGTIVQRVSGRTLRQFTTERIFTPLGMTHTHFHDDHTMLVPGRTSAYVPRGGGRGGAPGGAEAYAISIPVFDNAGATSLFTTVEDLARWDRNFLVPTVGDARLIDAMSVRGRLNNGDSIPYAFALTHGMYRGARTIGHSGADAGYRADYLRFPDQRMAFTVLCNIGTANPGQLTREVAAVVLAEQLSPAPEAPGAPPTPAAVTLSAAETRAFAGSYADTVNGSVRTLYYRDSTNSLHASAAPNAPAIGYLGNDTFLPPGATTRVRFVRRGTEVTGMMDVPGTTIFAKVPPAVTSSTAIAAIAGRYRSDELDVVWTLSPNAAGGLTLSRRRFPDAPVQPAYLDAFTTNVGLLRVTRDASGSVTGFLLTAGRVRNLWFERER